MSDTNETKVPSQTTLSAAANLSIRIGKPVCFYFYLDSCNNKVKIGTNNNDKVIYKNNEEHTSPISNIYKSEGEYLIVTENTIYVISSGVKVVKLPDDFDLEM